MYVDPLDWYDVSEKQYVRIAKDFQSVCTLYWSVLKIITKFFLTDCKNVLKTRTVELLKTEDG